MSGLSDKFDSPSTEDVPDRFGAALTHCLHCGLPTRTRDESSFCCPGCRGAYDLIHGWGLDAFYDLRDASTAASSLESSEDAFLIFDNEEGLGASKPRSLDDGTRCAKLTILGLHCAACVWLIEKVATRTDGWKMARVRMRDHSIELVYAPELIRLSEIARVLDRIGYRLMPNRSVSDDGGYVRQNREHLIRIAVAGFCAANAMWIAIALYAGEATGLDPSHRTFLRCIGTGLGLAAVAFPGRTFFVGAIASLRTWTPHMDLPIALGLLAGSVAGFLGVAMGTGHVYFDSLAVLVFLLLIGRWVQFRQQHRAARSVDLMLSVTPRHARRVGAGGTTTLVMAEHLLLDDVVRVPAGDSIPADGTIVPQFSPPVCRSYGA